MCDNFIPDKPFRPIEDQIKLLKETHNLIIKNEDFARIVLFSYSYYDLINGYKDVFMVDDKYINMTIEYLVMFYHLDLDIKSLLIKYAGLIEIRFKTIFAYYTSEYLGVREADYLNINKYSPLSNLSYKNQSKLKKSIDEAIETSSNSNFNPTYFYRKNHNHVPPWILFKNLTFDNCTKLFRFSNANIKDKTIETMLSIDVDNNYKNEFFISSLVIVRKFRNAIAHNLNFVNLRLNANAYQLNYSKLINNNNSLVTVDVLTHPKYKTSPFAMIVAISSLLERGESIKFKSELAEIIREHCCKNTETSVRLLQDYCKIADLPEDILHRLED